MPRRLIPRRVREWLGIKSYAEIRRETLRQPQIVRAQRANRSLDHVLREMEAIERRDRS